MYIDVPDLRRHKGIESSTDDDLLNQYILAAQKTLDNIHHRRYESVTATRYYTHDVHTVGRTLWLDDDLLTVTSITNGDGTTVTAGQYVLVPRNTPPYYRIDIKASANVTWTYEDDPEYTIVVVGTWGWSAEPDETIKQCCRELAAWFYQQKDTTGDSDRPIFAGDGNIIMPRTLPQNVIDMMKMHPSRRYV